MKVRRLNQKRAKKNQNKDGCNKKLTFVILQQFNVYHCCYFKSL